jgi:hypothetical protein
MTKPKIATTRKPSMTTQAQAGVIHGRNSNLDEQTEQWDADLKVFDQEWDNLFLDTFMLNNGEPEPTPETNSNDNDGEHKPTPKIYSQEKHEGRDTNYPKTSGLGDFSKINDVTPLNAKFQQWNTSNYSYDWNNWSRDKGTGAKIEARRGRTSGSKTHPISSGSDKSDGFPHLNDQHGISNTTSLPCN